MIIPASDAMSYALTLKARSSVLKAHYFPPIDLSSGVWSIALIGLETFNSIPNITSSNCRLHLGGNRVIEIPHGAYDIDDLNTYLRQHVQGFELRANVNTLKTEIRTKKERIDFTKEGSIASLLGYSKTRILTANENKFYVSDNPVDILPISSISVECSAATNAFLNNKLVHSVFGFYPKVGPGFKIIETPTTPIYMPVIVQALDSIELRVVDQDERLVNFRGEEIIIRLHLKQNNGSSI